MKTIISLLLSGILIFPLFGQNELEIPTIIPPSPDASALGKYGEIPVGHYTGIPKINIPLYTLSSRAFSVPVSLNYHAGGIKVEEMASRFGLGWSLLAGGTISRTMRSLPDEGPHGLLTEYGASFTDWDDILDADPLDQSQYFQHVEAGELDLEPDIFNFSFNGSSGQFTIDPSTGKAEIFPVQDVKIEYELLGGTIDRWILTNNDGVKYVYGKSLDETEIAREETSYQPISFTGFSLYTSAWQLVEMIHPNGDEIRFYYGEYSANYLMRNGESKYWQINSTPNPPNSSPPNLPTLPTSMQVAIEGTYLKQISSAKGDIYFDQDINEREDLITGPLNSSSATDRAIKFMRIEDKQGGLIKKYEFDYSYFYNPGATQSNVPVLPVGNDWRFKRLKLNFVKDITSPSLDTPTHTFTYNSTPLPEIVSNSQDHWGFYNGKESNTTLVPEYFVMVKSGGEWNPQFLSGANRSPDEGKMQAGILTNIQYPTGGSTSFTYEGNRVYRHDFGFEIPFNFGQQLLGSVNAVQASSNTPNSIDISTFSIDCNYNPYVVGELGAPVLIQIQASSACDLTVLASQQNSVQACGVILKLERVNQNGTRTSIPLVLGAIGSGNAISYYDYLTGCDVNITYELSVEVIDETEALASEVTCNIFAPDNLNVYDKLIGGLRIKKIEHYDDVDPVNNMVSHFTYEKEFSGTGEIASSGVLVSEPRYDSKKFIRTEQAIGNVNSSTVFEYFTRNTHSQIPLAATQGAFVGYGRVQMYQGPTIPDANGKTEYQFVTANNHPDLIKPYFPYPPSTSFDWRRGLLKKEIIFKREGSNFIPIQETENNYKFGIETGRAPKEYLGIKSSCWQSGPNGCEFFYMERYKMIQEWFYLENTTSKVYGDNTLTLSLDQTTYNYYDNFDHIYPTSTITTNSDGTQLKSNFRYPQDYDVTGLGPNSPAFGFKRLLDLGIHSTPVETYQQVKTNTSSNFETTQGSIVEYGLFNNENEIAVKHVYNLELAQPSASFVPSSINSLIGTFEKDPNYSSINEAISYNEFGQALSIKQRPGSNPTSIIWNLAKTNPIATVVNSNEEDIAYTSFESPGIYNDLGHWDITGVAGWSSTSKTGTQGYDLNNYRIVSTDITTPGEYILAFWTKKDIGQYVINQSYTIYKDYLASDSWRYYELKLNLSGNQALSIQGKANSSQNIIDELRLFPVDAQMNTATYDAASRLHTQTDLNGKSMYYEYDELGRLSLTRDQDRNILQTYEYNIKNN